MHIERLNEDGQISEGRPRPGDAVGPDPAAGAVPAGAGGGGPAVAGSAVAGSAVAGPAVAGSAVAGSAVAGPAVAGDAARGGEQRRHRIIGGAAINDRGRVLACERSSPPEVAGRWEFPGGKVEPGETEREALVRECDEELGVRVEVGVRVGRDVRLAHGRATLRVYAARLLDADQPQALEHADLRWLGVDELHTVVWLPADAPIVAALPPFLAAPSG